jgi:hypothetical protein
MGAPPAAPIMIFFLIAFLAVILLVIGLGIAIVRATILSFRDREDRRRREALMEPDFEIRPGRPGRRKAVGDSDLDF